ncbi:transglycosylase SLT domain-containing protein [Profundibacterium mesophilum]|uniref:Soluble lytic transglycosylase n=1 Tax=Profundibacterium mesophilum KAUST100406-0324 TaxID=1037889 RepID=A0A921NNI1_9RHOB|nr:transglycosylase SLT domain-containing protein [Profundibacterium mesophilum]KAF0674976.1 putative soluble lytic transglycosylase [Profundibacterium mesophilum KAUST100406-0324]
MKRLMLLGFLALSACGGTEVARRAAPPEPASAQMPAMRWDFRPESEIWTRATMDALNTHGAGLPAMVPSDYERWCPGYLQKNRDERAAFWAGLFSALAEHESTWNPGAVGGGGLWYGLVQIDPRTARGYGCNAKTGAALKDGAANLRCAVRIAAHQVLKRGTVARGMLDWGPFHSPSKRAQMQAWTRAQPYCTAEG